MGFSTVLIMHQRFATKKTLRLLVRLPVTAEVCELRGLGNPCTPCRCQAPVCFEEVLCAYQVYVH